MSAEADDAKWTVVYRVSPEGLDQLMLLLRKAGFNPTTLDVPGSVSIYAAGRSYLIRIAVPAEEAEDARSVLAEWEKYCKPKVDSLSRQVRRHVLAAFLPTLAVAAMLALADRWRAEFLGILGGVWVLSFVIIANVARTRRW